MLVLASMLTKNRQLFMRSRARTGVPRKVLRKFNRVLFVYYLVHCLHAYILKTSVLMLLKMHSYVLHDVTWLRQTNLP